MTKKAMVEDIGPEVRFKGQRKFIHGAIDFKPCENLATIGVWLPVKEPKSDRKGEQAEKDGVPIFIEKDKLVLIDNKRRYSIVEGGMAYIDGIEYIVSKYPNLMITGRWEGELIEDYLKHDIKINSIEVFEEIKAELKFYIDFTEEHNYTIVSLWIIGTYFFSCFDAYPYLALFGLTASGKSKVQEFCELLCFNAVRATSITPSALFRFVDGSRPTLFLDEQENLIGKNKNQDLITLLNSGFNKDVPVILSEKGVKDKFESKSYDVYGPKSIACIRGAEETTSNRSLVIHMLRTNKKSIGRARPDKNDPKWALLRHKLYLLYLQNAPEIYKMAHDEHIFSESELGNRSFEVAKAIITLAKWVGDVSAVSDVSDVYLQNPMYNEDDLKTTFYEFLISKANSDYKDKKFYLVKNITKAFVSFYEPEDEGYTPDSRWVGRRLKELKFDNRKVGRGREYLLSQELLQDRIGRYLYINITNSTNSTNNTELREKEDEEEIQGSDVSQKNGYEELNPEVLKP